jgi:nitrate/nitrite transport system ATP-binding protein
VVNPLPPDRSRDDMHRHPAYYAIRNHLIDFLVTRSRTFRNEIPPGYDPQHPPLLRPGIPAPTVAEAPRPAAEGANRAGAGV